MGLKRLIAMLAASAMLFSCAGCAPERPPSEPEPLTVLTIGTADSGGTMYPVGTAIAELLSGDVIKVNVGASTGSPMNIQSLANGDVDLALVSGDAADEAYRQGGEGAELRAVAAVFTSLSNWLVPEDQGIQYVHDLKGLRVGVGPENSRTELAARIVIDTLGLNQSDTVLVNCALSAGTELMPEGKISAMHGFAGIPIVGFADLAEKLPCRVLRYTQEELDAILASNSTYTPAVIPAGTYKGQEEDIATFGAKCLLCVDASMDEDLVYFITKTIWENRKSVSQAHPSMFVMEDAAYLFDDLPIPLHSGAARLYGEIG